MTHALTAPSCQITSIRNTPIARHEMEELERAFRAYIRNRGAWGNLDHIAHQCVESALWTFVIGEEGSTCAPTETAFSISPYLHPLGRGGRVSETIHMANLSAQLTDGIRSLLGKADIITCDLQEEIKKIRPLAKNLINAVQAHPDRTKVRARTASSEAVYAAAPIHCCAIL